LQKRLIRLGLYVVALLIVIIPLVAVYVVLRSREPIPSSPASIPATDKGDGLTRTLLGTYLGIRDSDIHRPAGTDPTPVRFVVQPGETADVIARNLQAAGLITDAELFRQLVKYQGVGENLQAGEYQLRATMTMEEVVAALQRSRKQETTVTVREGWRLEQIAQVLSQDGLSTYDDLMKVMTGGRFGYSVLGDRPAGASLEGYLYPDTYQMDPAWSADQIVDLLVGTMDRRFTPTMRQQAAARGLNLHQVLTLASMVEREAMIASERPLIAGVFVNRLAKNMPLQVDATVQYALGYDKTQQRWWPAITLDQANSIESPYNTYLYRGLPPGPIASPGLASIQAVLQATKTDYLYYVAKGDGSHVFAKTFEEHLDNIKKYQK